MLLSLKEKKILLKLITKEQRKLFGQGANKEELKSLEEKIRQSMRNEKTNETKPEKL
ncbi:hypothetical protein [Alkalicoccus luteus]|uniref:Uncharacterized protein n=1 Tax=Alkalicoccus luteus TaxID=1237094 RepID=A0A969TWS8_9BACI|nr:hypothetical protein [Alkalicoccus luteus]NJP39351.1 hypothetical protein [Alkalicoccus luteus]